MKDGDDDGGGTAPRVEAARAHRAQRYRSGGRVMQEQLSYGLTALTVLPSGGGLALGVESAGFEQIGLVEADRIACRTLRANRSGWPVVESDLQAFSGSDHAGVDLLAAGAIPVSIPRRRVGQQDDTALPEAVIELMRLICETLPRAVMINAARGWTHQGSKPQRQILSDALSGLGYTAQWHSLDAVDFGVPQNRNSVFLVALKSSIAPYFAWPEKVSRDVSVGARLRDLMAANGWPGADTWADRATISAPSILGTRMGPARKVWSSTPGPDQWARLGIDATCIAKSAPLEHDPRDLTPALTLAMYARLQGFPDDWSFPGAPYPAHELIRRTCPPPVAEAVGAAIASALGAAAVGAGALPNSVPEDKTRRRGSVSATVLKAVMARDGGECRYPHCGAGRLVTRTSGGEWVCTGEVAHIRAVSAGGPRYDPTYPTAMLNRSTNVLLMCTAHHRKIDLHDPDEYPVELLESWLEREKEPLSARVLQSLGLG